MEVRAIQKFVRMSPKKIRFVADVARKMQPQDAIEKLPFLGKKAADPVILVIKAAIANAKNKGIDVGNLTIKELQINEGPRLKRGRPVSRGRWHPYKRRMSHIRVVLETRNEKVVKPDLTKDEADVAKKITPVKKVIKSAKNVISKKGNKALRKSV